MPLSVSRQNNAKRRITSLAKTYQKKRFQIQNSPAKVNQFLRFPCLIGWFLREHTVKGFVLCKYTECGIIWTGTWGRQIIISFRWTSLEMETLVNGKFCDEQQEISKQIIGLCSAILASCVKHNACLSPVNQCETALVCRCCCFFFSFFFYFYITLFGEFKKKKKNKK